MPTLDDVLSLPDASRVFDGLHQRVESRAGSDPKRWRRPDATFLYACWFVNEMENGGLIQWFVNTTFPTRWRTRRAIRRIGADRTLAFIREASKKVPWDVLFTPPTAEDYVEMVKRHEVLSETIHDPFFEQNLRDEVQGRLIEYVKRHKRQFA